MAVLISLNYTVVITFNDLQIARRPFQSACCQGFFFLLAVLVGGAIFTPVREGEVVHLTDMLSS